MRKAKASSADEHGRRPWRRMSRNYFLKHRMQSRFVLGCSAIVASGFVLYLLLSYHFIDKHLAEELYRTHLKMRVGFGSVLWWPAVAVITATISVSVILVYYMTDRAQLHLQEFVGMLRRVGQGDLTGRIALNNAAEGLSESFNKAVSLLDNRFGFIKRSSIVLEDVAAQLGDATGGQLRPDAAQAALVRIAAERARVMEEIRGFKV